MTTPAFAFVGPDHQVVGATSGGRVVVRVWDTGVLLALHDAATGPIRVTATGPFAGGAGLEDPVSAYWAARAVVPDWRFIGEAPPLPEVPPWDPGVVYASPAA